MSIGVIGDSNTQFYDNNKIDNDPNKSELFEIIQYQENTLKYAYFNIYESFLNANSTTRYDETLKEIFLPDLDTREEESLDSFERRIEFFYKRKRAYGLLAAGAINENNVKSIINEVFNNFKDKILTQISDNALQREREEALSDLEDYKKSIEWNMNRLTKLLEINAKSDNWE